MELADRIAGRVTELTGEIEVLRKQLADAERELDRLVIAGQLITKLTAGDQSAVDLIVAAMATSSWDAAKTAVMNLFSRHSTAQQDIETRLDSNAARVRRPHYLTGALDPQAETDRHITTSQGSCGYSCPRKIPERDPSQVNAKIPGRVKLAPRPAMLEGRLTAAGARQAPCRT
jgi:hypothetical protein